MIFSPKWTLDFLPSVPQPPVSHSSVHGLNIHSTFTHSIPSAGTSISPFNVYQAAITFPPCSQSLSCTPTNVSIFYCFFFFFLAVVSSTQRWFETSTSPVTHAKVQECWISLVFPGLYPFPHHPLHFSPNDHTAFPPSRRRYSKLGMCTTAAISDQKALCRFWPSSLQCDFQISFLRWCLSNKLFLDQLPLFQSFSTPFIFLHNVFTSTWFNVFTF